MAAADPNESAIRITCERATLAIEVDENLRVISVDHGGIAWHKGVRVGQHRLKRIGERDASFELWLGRTGPVTFIFERETRGFFTTALINALKTNREKEMKDRKDFASLCTEVITQFSRFSIWTESAYMSDTSRFGSCGTACPTRTSLLILRIQHSKFSYKEIANDPV